MPQYFGKLPTTNQPWNVLGNVQSVDGSDSSQGDSQTGHSLDFFSNTSRLRISVLSPRLIRVRYSPQGEFLPHRSWAVALPDEAWEPVPFEVQQVEHQVEIKTDLITVQVEQKPGRIRCLDSQGQPFAADTEMGMGWRMGTVTAWKQIEADEHFYGFGERAGLLDQRSQLRTNWTTDSLDYDSTTDAMYQAIPFFMALRPGLAYGIFLNTPCWSQFDLGAAQPGIWQMTAQTTELDYYILYGPTPADILQTYTQLTGRMPLPPKWALGYHQCRWSYENDAVVRELAQEFRDRHIPCDVIHLDIDYMKGYRVFTWSDKRFPNPQQLTQDLQQQGFKIVTIVDPGVKYEPDGEYEVYHEGIEKDYFVRTVEGALFHGYVWPDKAVFPDFLRPEVRQWWGDWQANLTAVGVAGIWNDMNEPALNDRPFGDEGDKIIFPPDAPQGPIGEAGTHAETHNLYGLTMAQASFEGLQRSRPNERSFVLTRSGYAGIQRWSAVWTGDNQSSWEHLEMSMAMLCNLGLSGVSFVGADIGGFAGNATAELFARWMQLGMLYPLMRGHSAFTTARHEPWTFGDRVEAICREYIELRYQLIPYLYTLFWESANTGAPILRPLLYHYPDDPQTYHLHDQVMLGESLMAAPVYRPGVQYRAVYLPEGVWYDWWTGDRHIGPTHILAHAPLERMPLYAKAGAIIPMQPITQWIEESPIQPMRIKVFPGTGEFTFYSDDGNTDEYRTGNWMTKTYRIEQTNSAFLLKIGESQGNRSLPIREVILELPDGQEHRYVDDGFASSVRLSFASEET